MPKQMTEANKLMQNQRANEKAAMAAQAAGKKFVPVSASASGAGSGGGGGGSKVSTGGGGFVRHGDIAGSKQQWLTLLRLLQAGGREEAGGLGAVDFGVGYSAGVLSASARKERLGYEKYEKLPADLRAKLSKKEYEQMHFRGSDDEVEGAEQGLLPVVVFSFSKKKCEEIAEHLSGQDLLTGKEKGQVRVLMQQVMKRLNPQDARLPQVHRLQSMLSRGIGVHHGGLLPILKECVELLFSKSVVKILFATETFAMGVNMPARAVVFNGYRKHDGRGFRDLLPGNKPKPYIIPHPHPHPHPHPNPHPNPNPNPNPHLNPNPHPHPNPNPNPNPNSR